MIRFLTCTICGGTFTGGLRGVRAKACPSCRKQYYKQKYYHYIRKFYYTGLDKYSRTNQLKCLERDNYTCHFCGDTKSKLQVHHKDGNGTTHEVTNNELNNLITLCHACHMKEHGLFTYHTKEISAYRAEGKTFQTIGDILHLSRQRVHQIFKKSQYKNLP